MQVGARYYDPATGSFLTRDTDLSQLAYVYCGDDPIDDVDPSGHWKMSRRIQINLGWGAGGVAIIGIGLGAAATSNTIFVVPTAIVASVAVVMGTSASYPAPVNEIITWMQQHCPYPPTPPGAMPPGIYP